MSILDKFFSRSLTTLELGKSKITAEAPTGVSLRDYTRMEEFLIGLHTHSGQVITPQKAMRASAVLACIRILCEDLSALPLVVYKRDGDGGYSKAVNHPLFRILDIAPNDEMTSMELREHLILDLITNGNFYALKNEDPEGNLVGLWPLQAMYVTRRWRELVWTFNDPTTGLVGEFTPDYVWRGTIMSGNGLDGQALTLLAREAIGLLLAAEEQAARLFSNGVQSDLTISSPESVDDEERAQLRKAFMERHAGSRNAFLPILLENGMSANRIGLTAQESQYIEGRNFQIADIARVFRIPEVLLGGGTSGGKSSTYASAEQFFSSYVKHTLMPWAIRLEQTGNRDLLSPKDAKKYFIKHDFSQLLRGDTAARYASYSTGIASGFLSPAECRQAENLPTVPGLDYYTRPLNTDQAAGQDANPAPTDTSARRGTFRHSDRSTDKLANSIALHIFEKERKALVGKGQDANTFYTHFAGYVEDLTGASVSRVNEYLEARRTTVDRFSVAEQDKSMAHLIALCKEDK